jgi:hypothetical protein
MKSVIFWDWDDFGIALILRRQNSIGQYKFAIDFQIGWFNLWTQFWRKPISSEERVERELLDRYKCEWFEIELKDKELDK